MKIVLQKEEVNHIGKKIEQVVASVLEKAGASNIKGYKLTADILVEFEIEGSEEGQYLFTDRIVMGQPEILTILPAFDSDGNLIGKEDNTEETFEAIAEALSRELPTEPIISEFDDADLTLKDTIEASDLKELIYQHNDGRMVIRYYRKGVGYVGEISAVPKDGAIDG